MAIPFASPVDLQQNELQNAVIQNLSTPPSHKKGRIYFDTTSNLFGVSDGTVWKYIEVGALDIEAVQDAIAAMLSGSTVVTATYNDAAGTITLSIGAGQVTNAMLASGISADKVSAGSTNGVVTLAQVSKLNGIATGATANDTDANLKARANHTGTQAASTISDFASAVDARIAVLTAGAPAAMDTLDELANALGDDPAFATTITNLINARAKTFSQDIGDGTATTFVITHNLNTRDVVVSVRLAGSPYAQELVENEATTLNTVTLRFGATAPATGSRRVTIQGR